MSSMPVLVIMMILPKFGQELAQIWPRSQRFPHFGNVEETFNVHVESVSRALDKIGVWDYRSSDGG